MNKNNENRALELKRDARLPNGMTFKRSQVFQIAMGVLYIGGHPVEMRHQQSIKNWIKDNPDLFDDVTYKFL